MAETEEAFSEGSIGLGYTRPAKSRQSFGSGERTSILAKSPQLAGMPPHYSLDTPLALFDLKGQRREDFGFSTRPTGRKLFTRHPPLSLSASHETVELYRGFSRLHREALHTPARGPQIGLRAIGHFDDAHGREPASASRRLGLLVNKTAGSFAALGAKRLEAMLRAAGLSEGSKVVYCDGATLAQRACALAQSGFETIGVYGGDGSVRTVVEALKGYDVAILPLPGGTLNRLCHRVHGQTNLKSILSKLSGARPMWLSGGLANQHMFLVASGFGPWMGFETVRETARHFGIAASLKTLKAMRHDLFGGRVGLDNAPGVSDIIVAAPTLVDSAFGLGGSTPLGQTSTGLEVASARITNPMSVLKLGGHVLTKSWRNLASVTVQRGSDLGVHGDGQTIIGLVDGEFFEFGPHVQLRYHDRAALVLTTR